MFSRWSAHTVSISGCMPAIRSITKKKQKKQIALSIIQSAPLQSSPRRSFLSMPTQVLQSYTVGIGLPYYINLCACFRCVGSWNLQTCDLGVLRKKPRLHSSAHMLLNDNG